MLWKIYFKIVNIFQGEEIDVNSHPIDIKKGSYASNLGSQAGVSRKPSVLSMIRSRVFPTNNERVRRTSGRPYGLYFIFLNTLN